MSEKQSTQQHSDELAITQQQDNKLVAERRQKLDKIRKQGNAFPNQFKPKDKMFDLQAELVGFEKAELEEKHRIASVAGRIMAKRGPFLVLQDSSARIQLYIDKQHAQAAEIKTWDIGDLVYAQGPVHKSGKGDLYVLIEQAQLLTKSLRPLPEKFHGLADQEMRYRQRYVDLIMSEQSRQVFVTRTKVIEGIRRF